MSPNLEISSVMMLYMYTFYLTFNELFVQSFANAMTHFPPQGSLKIYFDLIKEFVSCNCQFQLNVNLTFLLDSCLVICQTHS